MELHSPLKHLPFEVAQSAQLIGMLQSKTKRERERVRRTEKEKEETEKRERLGL